MTTNIRFSPEEATFENVIIKGTPENLLSLCQEEKYQGLCKDEFFWQKMYNKYYADTEILTVLWEEGKFTTFYDLYKLSYALDQLASMPNSEQYAINAQVGKYYSLVKKGQHRVFK
jgi:hypothetical protein